MNNFKIQIDNYQDHLSWKNKLLRVIWNIAQLFLFRFFGTPIFRKWRIFILRLFGAKVDWTCSIYSSVKVWAPWNLEMGHHSVLAPNVDCYNVDKIIIEDLVVVSQKAFLCTASHNISNSKHPLITSKIKIRSQAWIGASAYVGMGVNIGQGGVVGATASVYKDVEPWTVVGGNPAKFLKKRIIKDLL